MKNKFHDIKSQVQEIIDLIEKKENEKAIFKISTLNEFLDELFDFSTSDSDLVSISKYKILVKQLEKKLNDL